MHHAHPLSAHRTEHDDEESSEQDVDTELQEGVLLAPSKYEAWFLTTAHADNDVDATIAAAEVAFSKL